MNTNPTEPSSTAAPVARASQPSPPMTALPSPPNANSGPSDEGIAGSLLPAKNSGREGNEPLTGNVVPVKDRPPSVKSAPSKDNAAAINDAPAGYDQSAGNNPQPGKNLGNLGSSEDFPLADQQPGQSSAGSPLFGDAPASFKAAFTTQVGGHVVQAATSTDGVIVDEQYMISRGGSIVLSGTPIALNTNGNLVLGTSTISNFLASLTSDSNAVFTVSREIGGHIIQVATSNDGILLDGQYITPGGPSIVLSGTSIAFHTNGNLVLGTSTVQNLYSSLASESNAVFTVGDEAITLFSNRLVAGAITLRPEDPSVTIDGTLLSLGLFGLRIGTKTIPLDFKTSPVPTAAITVAGRPIQPLPNRMAIAGATLTANAAAITLAGTPVSFGDNRLIVGTSTISLRSPNPTSILTVGGQKYTFSEIASGVSIAGTTLQIGQAAVTISGTLVALDSSGLVINGTSTIPYQSVDGATALPNAIGGLILAGFNVGPTTSSTTAASAVSMSSQRSMTGSRDGLQAFIGRASRREIPLNGLTVIALVLLLTILRCVVF